MHFFPQNTLDSVHPSSESCSRTVHTPRLQSQGLLLRTQDPKTSKVPVSRNSCLPLVQCLALTREYWSGEQRIQPMFAVIGGVALTRTTPNTKYILVATGPQRCPVRVSPMINCY